MVFEPSGERQAIAEAGLDIVRRALAILDEEVRAWGMAPPPPPPASADDKASAPEPPAPSPGCEGS